MTGSRESHRRIQQHERQTTPSLHFLLIHEHLHGEGQPAAPVSRTNQAAILQMGESPPMGILAAGQRRHHAPRGGTLTSPEKFLKCSPPRWATRNPSRHCCPWRRRWQIPSPPRASRTSTRGRTPRRARRRAHQVLSHHVQLSDLFKVIADRVQTIKDFIVANDVVLMACWSPEEHSRRLYARNSSPSCMRVVSLREGVAGHRVLSPAVTAFDAGVSRCGIASTCG